MKKFVNKKYTDIILQLARKYKNENSSMAGGRVYCAMDRTLETMDKYVANINGMGYMMYSDSIECMLEYITVLMDTGCEFPQQELQQLYDHLKGLYSNI